MYYKYGKLLLGVAIKVQFVEMTDSLSSPERTFLLLVQYSLYDVYILQSFLKRNVVPFRLETIVRG